MLTSPPVAVDYGLGHLIMTLDDGRKIQGHAGVNRGWRSFWAVDRENRTGIVVLSNSEHEADLPARVVCAWGEAVVGARIALPIGIKGCS